jgi:DNA-binding transcriptional MocR family regulator
MNIKLQLMQKYGLVTIKLAREFITMTVGDRINTIAEYAAKYETARGTVQAALKLLEENKAVRIEPRGHLGTFITNINYEVLWEYTDFSTIMGVMPLPYSKLYEGLATGLYKEADNGNFPFSLAYMRGAENRIKALSKGRYDFAVVSKLAAQHSIKNGSSIDIALQFGKYSYVNEHVMVFSHTHKKSIEDGMKIGVDKSSIDHYLLTLAQCREKMVEIIDLPYNQVVQKLMTGEIDAAVWNIDEIVERKLNINYYPLEVNNFSGEDTEAVLIINKSNYGIKNLMEQFIDCDKVVEYQRRVITGELIPNY